MALGPLEDCTRRRASGRRLLQGCTTDLAIRIRGSQWPTRNWCLRFTLDHVAAESRAASFVACLVQYPCLQGRTFTYSSSVFSGEEAKDRRDISDREVPSASPIGRKEGQAESSAHAALERHLQGYSATRSFPGQRGVLWNLSFYISGSVFTNGNTMPSSEYHCLKLVPRRKEEGKEEFSHGKALPIFKLGTWDILYHV